MLCSRCGKRPAVVFVSTNNPQDEATKGYCLTCAKELGIKPVEDLINKMGISDDDLENVQDQMDSLLGLCGQLQEKPELLAEKGIEEHTWSQEALDRIETLFQATGDGTICYQ